MIRLALISQEDISHFSKDFVDKSGSLETTEEDEVLGIFSGSELVGYFAVNGEVPTLAIHHGFLTPTAQHQGLPKVAMKLLEQKARSIGYTCIELASARRYRSYSKFMGRLGYAPDYTVYSKRI